MALPLHGKFAMPLGLLVSDRGVGVGDLLARQRPDRPERGVCLQRRQVMTVALQEAEGVGGRRRAGRRPVEGVLSGAERSLRCINGTRRSPRRCVHARCRDDEYRPEEAEDRHGTSEHRFAHGRSPYRSRSERRGPRAEASDLGKRDSSCPGYLPIQARQGEVAVASRAPRRAIGAFMKIRRRDGVPAPEGDVLVLAEDRAAAPEVPSGPRPRPCPPEPPATRRVPRRRRSVRPANGHRPHGPNGKGTGTGTATGYPPARRRPPPGPRDAAQTKGLLGELLVLRGVVTDDQVAAALQLQKGTGKRLGEMLVDMGVLDEQRLVEALADLFDMPVSDLRRETPTRRRWPSFPRSGPGDLAIPVSSTATASGWRWPSRATSCGSS